MIGQQLSIVTPDSVRERENRSRRERRERLKRLGVIPQRRPDRVRRAIHGTPPVNSADAHLKAYKAVKAKSDKLKADLSKIVTLGEAVMLLVRREFGVSKTQILSNSRHWDILIPRQIATWLMWKHSGNMVCLTARVFHRDHSTVGHTIKIVAERLAKYPVLAEHVARIEPLLEAWKVSLERNAVRQKLLNVLNDWDHHCQSAETVLEQVLSTLEVDEEKLK